MQERLSRYIRTRTGILTAMSHDLKTPITRLRLRAELLEQPELREKFVRDLSEMEDMVNTTLGYMRGLDDREALASRSMSRRCWPRRCRPTPRSSGQALVPRDEPPLAVLRKTGGFEALLAEPAGQCAALWPDAELAIEDKREGTHVVVRDRGPGIPEDQLERVFEPFFRLEASRNPGTGGTGLGLSIARNIAQSMGGEISCAIARAEDWRRHSRCRARRIICLNRKRSFYFLSSPLRRASFTACVRLRAFRRLNSSFRCCLTVPSVTPERIGDLLVGHAFREQRQDLQLPRRQRSRFVAVRRRSARRE